MQELPQWLSLTNRSRQPQQTRVYQLIIDTRTQIQGLARLQDDYYERTPNSEHTPNDELESNKLTEALCADLPSTHLIVAKRRVSFRMANKWLAHTIHGDKYIIVNVLVQTFTALSQHLVVNPDSSKPRHSTLGVASLCCECEFYNRSVGVVI